MGARPTVKRRSDSGRKKYHAPLDFENFYNLLPHAMELRKISGIYYHAPLDFENFSNQLPRAMQI